MLLKTLLIVVALVIVAGLVLVGCQAPRHVPAPKASPVGQRMPTVSGKALDGTAMTLPQDLTGQPAVILVGYVQAAQEDIDPWLAGLKERGTPARVIELPTIPSRFWTAFSGMIDGGMRNGIAKPQWGSVMTLWGASADPLVAFLGNDNPRLGRVLLLDRQGTVVWLHDRGFDAARLAELDAAARKL